MDCDSERIWKIVESQRVSVPRKKRPTGSSTTLPDRLYDCYVDALQASNDKSADKRFRSAVNLLHQVERTNAKPSLIVSLYEDEKGYSLMLCPGEGGETEEIFLPYEDNDIFSYLDNQEVPPVLMEVLEQTQYCHLYNGSVVCEVRDYRCHSVLDGYDKHLLLLRPTIETILATVNELAHESRCSHEEKLFLEARLLLATQPPICLDTSTDVLCVTNRLQYNRRKFHTHGIKRYLRKRSHAARALMQMTAERDAPERLKLNDFVSRRDTRPQKRNFSNCWKKPKLSLDTPQINFDEIARDVFQLAQPIKHGRENIQTEPLASPSVTHPHHTSHSPPTQPHRAPAAPQPAFADELLKSKTNTTSQRKQDCTRENVQQTLPAAIETPTPQQAPKQQQQQQQQVIQTSHTQQPKATPPPPQSITPQHIPQALFQNQQLQLFANPALQSLFVARQQPPSVKALGLRPIAPALPTLKGPKGVMGSLTPPQLRAIAHQHRNVSVGTTSTVSKTESTVPLAVSASLSSTTLQKQTASSRTMTTPSKVGGVFSAISTLTPPKLNPSPKFSPSMQTGVSSGMPKLHPLIPDLSKPPQLKLKPTPPVPVSPQRPTIVTMTPILPTSSAGPAMPQLHRMPTAFGQRPLAPRLSSPPVRTNKNPPSLDGMQQIPALKPNPASLVHSKVITMATMTTQALPSPSTTVPVVRTPPKQSAEAIRKMAEAQTRMPPSLSALEMDSPKKTKHSQSRSSKFISGTKVKSRKKK